MLMSCVVLYFLQGAHSLGLGLRVEEKPKTIGFLHQNEKPCLEQNRPENAALYQYRQYRCASTVLSVTGNSGRSTLSSSRVVLRLRTRA
jgi:hypothetical protein